MPPPLPLCPRGRIHLSNDHSLIHYVFAVYVVLFFGDTVSKGAFMLRGKTSLSTEVHAPQAHIVFQELSKRG